MDTDVPLNRRGFKYKPAAPTDSLPCLKYATTDEPPYKARLSHFDRPYQVGLDPDCIRALTDAGWHSIRLNVGVSEGKWYFEYVIHKANEPGDIHSGPHARVGIARREAAILAPVGYDAYGYAIRDVQGQKIHLSRRVSFMEDELGFSTGDVIGFLIELPDIATQKSVVEDQIIRKTPGDPYGPGDDFLEAQSGKKRWKSSKKSERDQIAAIEHGNIKRDQVAIVYKGHTYYEQFEYQPTAPFEHLLNPVTVFGERAVKDEVPFRPAKLPGLRIVVYKNGKCIGTMFESLYAFLPPSLKLSKNQLLSRQYNDDGSLGYYPMASMFKQGEVELNPGPELKYMPEDLEEAIGNGTIRLLHERYAEQIAEDVVYDLLDEVEEEMARGLKVE